MKINPSHSSFLAQVFSKTRLLLTVLLAVIIAFGVFYKQRTDTLNRSRQIQLDRVADAQLNLRKEVQLTLGKARHQLELEAPKKAKQSLRRASILDVDAEFSKQIYQLKNQISQLELEITEREDLRKERELALRRAQQIQASLQSFKLAVAEWDEIKATEHFRALTQLAAQPELLTNTKLQLDALQKTNAIVTSVVERIGLADTGQYSTDLLAEIELQIKKLGAHPKLLEIQKNLLSHPQTIQVPTEVSSLDEAYAQLKNGGTIELAEGVFYTEIEFDKSVVIKGAGAGVTILESRTTNAAGLHFSSPNKNYKVSNLTLRGVPSDTAQHPLLQLSGGLLDLSNVAISNSNNHGMAVIGGSANIQNCQFSNNRWDGLAIFGATSLVNIKNSSFHENADHGIDIWGAAKVQLVDSQSKKNSKSGIVVSGAQSQITLANVESNANRECGIYLSHGASLNGTRVNASNNRFSGLVAQNSHVLGWINSDASSNGEFGYVIDKLSSKNRISQFIGTENKIGLLSQQRLRVSE